MIQNLFKPKSHIFGKLVPNRRLFYCTAAPATAIYQWIKPSNRATAAAACACNMLELGPAPCVTHT